MVNILIGAGADIDFATKPEGCTPLYGALQEGHVEVVIFLINAGADLSKPTAKGETPLHVAVYAKRVDVVRVLVEAGADIDQKSKNGDTPMSLAGNDKALLDALNSAPSLESSIGGMSMS